MSCPICLNIFTELSSHPTRDAYTVICPQCATFVISGSAKATLESVGNKSRWKVSAWLVQYRPDLFTTDDLQSALNSSVPSLRLRADRMLRWIAITFPPGQQFSISDFLCSEAEAASQQELAACLLPIGWNKSKDEAEYMVAEVLCNELGLLVSQNNHDYQVSPKGLLYLEGRIEDLSSIGFCAMWFNEEVAPLWKSVIEPAIRAAGYEPLRIDGKHHNGKIDDEIMASIRSSRFVVADFTGNRGGVYYEAGFAHGLGLPVVFMCREGVELHFDVRQYNCIFWRPDELEDAQARLKNRILATLGQGPLQLK
jgi:hypothetical protein